MIELGDLPSQERGNDTCIRLQFGGYIPDVLASTEPIKIGYKGKFHSCRILIKPPCECIVCAQQFRPKLCQRRWVNGYDRALTDDEPLKEATCLVRHLRENLQYLRHQYEANGRTIFKRWKKRNSEKRKALLLEVDPDLYPHQWSDIRFTNQFMPTFKAMDRAGDSWTDLDTTQGRARRPYRNISLLPYINLESLSDDPARLMSILYNRIKYSPEKWASYDNYLLDKPWNIGAFSLVYNGNCIVMHGCDYGKLVSWEKEAAHAWDIVGFPRAILVLEAQMKLSKFLKGLVAKLIEGCREGQESDAFNQALEPGLKNQSGTSSCVELSSVYLNQPFSAPPVFDINLLLSIAQSQVDLHGDHLWLMQVDPFSLRRYSVLVFRRGT